MGADMVITGQQGVRVEPKTALPTDAEILAQLDRIRSSVEFEAPDRARKFLAYVVEETVAGRAGRIKAYSIATEVFGRDSSFDAQTDPAVRIEAGRIRRALERYYLVAGRDDSIVIKIPKGGYVPTFESRAKAEIEASPSPSAFAGPIVSIEPPWQQWIWVGIAAIAVALGGLAANALLQSGTTKGDGSNTARPQAEHPDAGRFAV